MLEKLSEKRNDVIGRSELRLSATVEGGTPSRGEVLKAVSDWLKIDANRISIVKIEPSFGSPKSLIHVRVYDSPQTLMFVEPRYRLVRMGVIQAEKGKGKAAA
jgi:ribosomal protein S24E